MGAGARPVGAGVQLGLLEKEQRVLGIGSVRRAGRPWATVALLLLACATARAAVPFDKALSEECVGYLSVTNLSALKEAVNNGSMMKMFRDPAMKPFVDGVTGEVNKLLDMAHQMTGVSLPEILSLPTGQVGIALRVDPQEPNSMPYIYFLADVKGNEEAVKSVLERLTQILEDAGMTKSTDGDLTVFSQEQKTPRQQPCFALKGTVLAIGNDPESLKAVVGALEGGLAEKSLASNPRFQEFRQQAGETGDFELYVDMVKVAEMAADVAGAEAGAAVTMLGLNSFQSAGVSATVGKGDYETKTELMLLVKGSTPLMNLIHMPGKPMKPEEWVPADAVSYLSFNWDLELFFSTLTNLVNAVSPGGLEQIDAMLAGPDPDNPLLNIKNDLIGPLGNRLSIMTDMLEEKDGPSNRMLVAWQLDDSDKLNALIDRVLQLAGGALPLQDKMVKGNKVYFFPLGDLLAAQMPDQEMPVDVGVVGFTITKTHFMLATHVELLDKVLEAEGKPGLAESPEYQKVAAKFPAQTSMISYTRADEQFKALFQMVKSGQLAKMLRQSIEERDEIAAFLGGIIDSLEGKNLPEFSAVKKYVAPSGMYAIMNEKGIKATLFSLNP